MAVACARVSLGTKAPELKHADTQTIAKYAIDFRNYETQLRWIREYKTAESSGIAGWQRSKGATLMKPAPAVAPECPEMVRNFLTLLEVSDAMDIETARVKIDSYVAQGQIRTFLRLRDGTHKRYAPDKYKTSRNTTGRNHIFWSGALPWYGQNAERTYCPIVILKEDFDYFMQHGEPKPQVEMDPLPRKETGELPANDAATDDAPEFAESGPLPTEQGQSDKAHGNRAQDGPVSEAALRKWDTARIKSFEGKPAPSERDDVTAANEKFGAKITRERVRTMRTSRDPDGWNVKRPGRKTQ